MLPTLRTSAALLFKSLILFIAVFNCSYAATDSILVSIKPLHSLISHITEGVNQTDLLLDQQQSAHHFHLLPSQKRKLNQSDILFYSSDNIEGFVRSLKNASDTLEFIELSKIPGLATLANRSFHSHETKHPAPEEHTATPPEADDIDGHIWLSINNAKKVSRYITDYLSKRSPADRVHYEKNLSLLLDRLNQLQQQNSALLTQVKDKPFLVYHDAFQYLERENSLSAAHFVTTSPEHSPGIKRIKELKQLILEKNIQCIFYEPPNKPALIDTLGEHRNINATAIDPGGAYIDAGKQHYFILMRQIADKLYECLSKP